MEEIPLDPSVPAEQPRNTIARGDAVNLTQNNPMLSVLHAGLGWEKRDLSQSKLDVDLCCFLLGKDGVTREDSDFIFYNNLEGGNGTVIHKGDSQTGTGDGDDESLTINLTELSYEVLEIVFVLSLYRGDERGQDFTMTRDSYFRLKNKEDGMELLRYKLDQDLADAGTATGFVAGSLVREGPEWFFKAKGEALPKGLAGIATEYGIVVAS